MTAGRCSNAPCRAPLELETCPLVRDEHVFGRLVPLCEQCARIFVIAHPDRFTPARN